MPKFSDFTAADAAVGADLLVGLQGGTNRKFTFDQVAAFVCPGQTAFGVSLQASANAAAARSVLGLIIGTNVQGASSNLEALSLASAGTNKLFYFTGPTTAAAIDFLPVATAYTPTVTADTGSITSSTASGGYIRIGPLIVFWALVTITNAGTGAGGLNISLPATAAALATFSGRENALTGAQIQGNVSSGSNVMSVRSPSNATIIATNAQVRISGFFFA